MSLRLGGTFIWLAYIFLADLDETLLAELIIFDTIVNFFAMFSTIGVMQSYKLAGAGNGENIPRLSTRTISIMVTIVFLSGFLTYYQFFDAKLVIIQLLCVFLVGYCLLHSSFNYGARNFILGATLDSSTRYLVLVLLLVTCDLLSTSYDIFYLYLGSCFAISLFLGFSFRSATKGDIIQPNLAYFSMDTLNAIARYGYVIASTLVLSVPNAAIIRIAIDSATLILLPQQVYLGMLAGELAPNGTTKMRMAKYQKLAVEMSRFIPASISGLIVLYVLQRYSVLPEGISSLLSFSLIAAIFAVRCITILMGPAIQAALFTGSAQQLSLYSFGAVGVSILLLLISGFAFGVKGVIISICFGIILRYWVAIHLLAAELSVSTYRLAFSTIKKNFDFKTSF